MAKAKQNEISLEEILEQALVPEYEQPYRVPKNWVWTRLGNVVHASDKKTELFVPGEKYVGLEHIEKDGGIIENGDSGDVKSLKNIFKTGNILYGKLRPYLNKHDVVTFNGICSTDILVLEPSPACDVYLVNNYLNLDKFIEYAVSNSKGINLPRVSLDVIFSATFPLPPLAEQRRIVERIESLFEKLDNAKELARNALETFETRKAAILHKAFTGEVTAKWRAKNGVEMDSWAKKSLVSVFKFIDYRGKTPTKTESGIPLVTAKNVKKGYIDYTIQEYISTDEFKDRKSRGVAQKGDILFTTEAPLGNVALADLDTYSTAQRLIVLQQNGTIKINNKCVMYYMLTGDFQNKLDDQKTGSTVAGIKAEKLKNLEVLLPTFAEQQEIVRILDSLFQKEERAKELSDVIDKIDLIKKAILARAFRGELGTNDPNDESSLGLLKECLKSNEM